MNIDGIVKSLSNLWARHSPTVIMHIAIFVVLQWWVLDPSHMLLREPLWQSVKSGVSSALSEAGITIPVGYAIAAIAYLYLNVFQWLADAIIKLPGLRPWYVGEPSLQEDFARHAGQVLRTPPNMFVTREKLDALVDNYIRRFRERGEPEPYSWLQNGISRWTQFYGLSVLGALGTFAWFLEGGSRSVSRGRIFDLSLALMLFASFSRWQYVHKRRFRIQQLRYGAMNEAVRTRPEEMEPDELRYQRSELLSESARYWRSYYRHPTSIVMRWLSYFPRKPREKLARRIAYLPAPLSDIDWEIICSKFALFAENTVVPPLTLNVDRFKEHFRNLLECRGAGLFLLVEANSGLAPSVPSFGSEYCFATRRHGGNVLTIRFRAGTADEYGRIETASYGDKWSFLADLGVHPIELAAQGQFPAEANGRWWDLTSPSLDTNALKSSQFNGPEDAKVCGISVRSSMAVGLGHSYLLRARMVTGTQAVIVFQCFGTGGSGQLLIAWTILAVIRDRNPAPLPLPWWKPESWNGLLKKDRKMNPT